MNITVHRVDPNPPEVTGVTLELTAGEARALLRVVGAASNEKISDARLAAFRLNTDRSIYSLLARLRKALS